MRVRMTYTAAYKWDSITDILAFILVSSHPGGADLVHLIVYHLLRQLVHQETCGGQSQVWSLHDVSVCHMFSLDAV